MGLVPKRKQIEAAANSILREAYGVTSLRVSEHWIKRFLGRHPEYYRRRRRALDLERMQAHDKSSIELWFRSYHDAIERYGITPQDIWNFDETGFQIGVGKDQFIITREPKKKIFSGANTNRESVPVIEAVNTTGSVISPLIVLSSRQALLRWFDHINDERVAISDSGFANDLLIYQWIQHFYRATAANTVGVYRLLLCDGFGSHLTREFISF